MQIKFCAILFIYLVEKRQKMATSKKGGKPEPAKKSGDERSNQKAFKKRPKIWDAIKRRLVTKK